LPTPARFRSVVLAMDRGDPRTLYAGQSKGVGVFKSTDGGGSWGAVNTGLTVTRNNLAVIPSVQALAIDPSAASTLYAGSNNGVFKSLDSAAHWSQVNTLNGVVALAIDRATPSTLYAGIEGRLTNHGVVKSIDSGGNWTSANSGLTGTSIDALVIDR